MSFFPSKPDHRQGLPDFQTKKSLFGQIWEGLAMEDVAIFNGH
jgi:hypothetical protein